MHTSVAGPHAKGYDLRCADCRRELLLVPLAATVLAALAVVATSFVPVGLAIALTFGAIVVVLIRLAPLQTVTAITLIRASLEGLSNHVVISPLGLKLSPPDLLTIALLAGGGLWLISKIRARTFDWGVPTLLPTLIFLSVAVLSLSYSTSWVLGARDIFKFAGAYCAFLIIMQSRPDRAKLRLLLLLVAFSAVLPILMGWYQFTHSIGKPGLYHGGLRIQATFDHPNTYGFYLVSILAAVWGLLPIVKARQRAWVIAIGVAAFISIFTTLSRNTWGALALMVVVIGYKHRRILLAAAMAAAGVIIAMPRTLSAAGGLVNPRTGANRGNSLFGRLDLWHRDISFWRGSPILGRGFGTTQGATGSLDHNDYLRALVEGGLIGFIAYLCFMGSLVRAGWRSSRGRSDLPLSFFGLSLGYMSVSLASNNFGKGAFQFYFWVVAAISLLWSELPPATDDDWDARTESTFDGWRSEAVPAGSPTR